MEVQAGNGTTLTDEVHFIGYPRTVTEARLYYVHDDHLGTPRAVTDEEKTLVWLCESDPFGTTPAQVADQDGTVFLFNLRFPGQYFDE